MGLHVRFRAALRISAVALPACALDGQPDVGASQHAETALQGLHYQASHNTYEELHTPIVPDMPPTFRQIKWHFREQMNEAPPNPTATMHIELDLRDSVDDESFNHTWWVAHDPVSTAVTRHCGNSADGTLNDCLASIETFHDNNPGHAFISVWIDKKDAWPGGGLRTPADLDARIADHFSGSELLTPSDICGSCDSPTLHEAIESGGWPTDEDLEGQIMFVLTAGVDNVLGTFVQNTWLEEYTATLGSGATAFVAAPIDSEGQIDDPDLMSVDWVAIFNFQWSSATGMGNDACNESYCDYLDEAAARNFLTRAWDLDDDGEEGAASDAGANFLPVNCPWLTGEDRFNANCPQEQ